MKEEEFRKLTKKQKLDMPCVKNIEDYFCTRVVLIPTGKKMDGWSTGSCFIETKAGWLSIGSHDCFRFTGDGITIKGDFEYGGVQFFREKGFIYSYGHELKCI